MPPPRVRQSRSRAFWTHTGTGMRRRFRAQSNASALVPRPGPRRCLIELCAGQERPRCAHTKHASICVCAPLPRLCRTLTHPASWVRGAILDRTRDSGDRFSDSARHVGSDSTGGLLGDGWRVQANRALALPARLSRTGKATFPRFARGDKWERSGRDRSPGFGPRMLPESNRRSPES
jgi:hypothetical protein